MLTKEQLAERKNQIGGSDIASILGMSPWKTALQLWAEKTGTVEPDVLSDKEYVQLGIELEDFVCKKFEKKTDMKVRRDNRTFVHKDYPYMVAHIDRRIVGTEAILEAKTCSSWKLKAWEGEEIPEPYILQCLWYMGITGMKKCYICCLIGGQKFVWKEVKFDEELFNSMVEKAKDFWEEYVLKNIQPMAVSGDKDFMVNLYPSEKNDELQVANNEVEDWIAHLQESKMHIKEMKKETDDLESKIKQIIGETTGLQTEKYIVTWKSQNGSPKYLKQRMIDDGIFEKYTEPTTRRVMRVKLNKGE